MTNIVQLGMTKNVNTRAQNTKKRSFDSFVITIPHGNKLAHRLHIGKGEQVVPTERSTPYPSGE
jgi:hypothetical protein